jgi:hypothetical protein
MRSPDPGGRSGDQQTATTADLGLSSTNVGSVEDERVTPTLDLTTVARELDAARSDVRPLIAPSMVPWLMVTLEERRLLPLDPHATFLVSLVDGQSSVEMIANIAGVPRDETARTFAALARLGAVELRDPAR